MNIKYHDPSDQEPVKDSPTDPSDSNDTSVKGYYNPVNSIGGANTGDYTQVMLYVMLVSASIGAILLISYKNKQEQ